MLINKKFQKHGYSMIPSSSKASHMYVYVYFFMSEKVCEDRYQPPPTL